MKKLIELAVQRRAATLALTLAFAAFGVATLLKLKVEAFPDVTNVQVMVITLYPGAGGRRGRAQGHHSGGARADRRAQACWCSARSPRSGSRR